MKKSIVAVALIALFTGNQVLAMCTWGIAPAGKVYEPLDATEAFISYDNGVQTLVLQPEFKGDATDFAIVYPTPSKPEVSEAPETLFDELDDRTNIQIDMMFAEVSADRAAAPASVNESVVVVEQKQVGDYISTVLTATDADDLAEWLEDNGYNFTSADSDKVDYYVAQGGYYFIALKVDMSEAELDDDGSLFGELNPIQFAFKTDAPQLPMRTLKSAMPVMTFDLYTLSDEALYVPGVDTVWSDVVDVDFLSQTPALTEYSPKGKWLVRQEVRFDPKNSDADLMLSKADGNTFQTANPMQQIRITPSELAASTGILQGTRGKVVSATGSSMEYGFTRSLNLGAVGADVLALQQFLNREGFEVSATGAGSPGNETNYFGGRTKQALIQYQNFNRAGILTPVGLQFGTGYFGPSTIAFIGQ